MSDTNKKEYLDLPGLTEYHNYVKAALDEKASAEAFIELVDRVNDLSNDHLNFATKDDLKNISGNVVVDDHLSKTSKNPVQNWVILAALKTEHDNTAATYATKEELNSLDTRVSEIENVEWATLRDLESYTTISYVDTKWNEAIEIIGTNFLTKYEASNTYATKSELTLEINSINQTLQEDYATKTDLGNLTAGDVDAIGTEYFEEYQETIEHRISELENGSGGIYVDTITDIQIDTFNCVVSYTLDKEYNLVGTSNKMGGFTLNDRTYDSIIIGMYEDNLESICRISALTNVISNEIGPKIKALETTIENSKWITMSEAQAKLDELVSGIELVFLTKSDAKATYALKSDITGFITSSDVSDYTYSKTEIDNKIANATTGGQIDLSGYLTTVDAATTYATKTELANLTISATKVGVDFAGEDLNTYLDNMDTRVITLETANENGIYVNDTVTIEIPAYYATNKLELDQNYNLAGGSISVDKETKNNSSYKAVVIKLYQDIGKVNYLTNALSNVINDEIGPKIKALEDANTANAYATKDDLQGLSNTVSDLDEVVAGLHTSISTTDSDVAELNSKVTTLETDMAATAMRVTDALDMIDDLNADMGNALDKIAALEARIKALEDALGTAMEMLDRLNGEVI